MTDIAARLRLKLSCEVCGNSIKTGLRGPVRRFCSSTCQSRKWREDHADQAYRAHRERYLAYTEEDRVAARKRAAARGRALSQLAERYPDEYRMLYDEEMRGGIMTKQKGASE